MKHIILIAVLGVSCAFTYGNDLPDFPFVFAEGLAKTNVAPDTALMTFDLKVFNEVSSNAVANIQEESIKIIELLASQGFHKDSIVSFELDKRAVRETDGWKDRKITGYKITRSFELTIDDLSKYEVVANALFKMENIVDIDTEFGRKDQKNIEALILTTACANAKQNAQAMSAGFGGEVGSVFSISQQGFINISAAFGLGVRDIMSMKQGFDWTQNAGGEFLFIPSTITFENRVSVLFKLKQKDS